MLAIGVVLLLELAVVLGGWKIAPDAMSLRFAPTVPTVPNTVQLGRLIYTDYILLFQAAGLVLLVAMIGAIVLTLRDRASVPPAEHRAADRAHAGRDDGDGGRADRRRHRRHRHPSSACCGRVAGGTDRSRRTRPFARRGPLT